ncbi:MAG: FKBP-type peptidyl-prolyl cis-trans isomerase [Bacteroidales bacterium]|nr:FKBP-type peptidyl-prolyl cis-trans isomerase [Bacteroidales bacterium]
MLKSKLLLLFLACFTGGIFAQKNKPIQLKNEIDSVSYSLGSVIGQSMRSAGISQLNEALFIQAVKDALANKEPLFNQQQVNTIMQNYMMKVHQAKAQKNLEEGKKFLSENAKKEGVVTLPSGLQYKVLKEGVGQSPSINDEVTCHYRGTFIDGKVFDSSYDRGEPARFAVNGVIKGWTEALQLMKPGSKWMLYIPADLGYGDQNIPGIEPNSVLIFEVELLSVEKPDSSNSDPTSN